jgi:hypothetical protein
MSTGLQRTELPLRAARFWHRSGGNARTLIVEDEQQKLQRLIERCRRLAREMTDEATREALERLALDYEAQLHRTGGSFMLGSASPREEP